MAKQTIEDVAHDDVVTAHPDAPPQGLARQMRDENVGSVVIETASEPIGIVTDRDLTVEVLAAEADRGDAAARELMTTYPTTIEQDLGVAEAVERMDDHDVRRLPVVDASDSLVGIVTLDDIYRELVAEHEHLAGVIAAESPD